MKQLFLAVMTAALPGAFLGNETQLSREIMQSRKAATAESSGNVCRKYKEASIKDALTQETSDSMSFLVAI